jgi:hypothetical protein
MRTSRAGENAGGWQPGGPCQGVNFKFEHVGEFEAIFETALGPESKAMKILELKIFRHSPFNDAMQDVRHCKKNEEKNFLYRKTYSHLQKCNPLPPPPPPSGRCLFHCIYCHFLYILF